MAGYKANPLTSSKSLRCACASAWLLILYACGWVHFVKNWAADLDPLRRAPPRNRCLTSPLKPVSYTNPRHFVNDFKPIFDLISAGL